MKPIYGVLLLAAVACGTSACQQTVTSAASPPPQQPAANTPQPRASAPAQGNPNQEANDRYVKQQLEKIAGRENEPAGQVFKNLQLENLKTVPAGRFLRIMNGGYSRALGVSCTHCHVEQNFASDEKRPKHAAREMALMHRSINEQLRKMQNLKSDPQGRAINCSTCHRGAIDPMASER